MPFSIDVSFSFLSFRFSFAFHIIFFFSSLLMLYAASCHVAAIISPPHADFADIVFRHFCPAFQPLRRCLRHAAISLLYAFSLMIRLLSPLPLIRRRYCLRHAAEFR